MPKNTSKSRVDEYDDVDIRFLMAEYDRLKGLAVENDNAQHRRFDFYLVAATAIVAGIISLQQASLSIELVERMTYLLLLVWLVWGIVAFVNLTYMNVSEQHIVNAINEIQEFFFKRNKELEKIFYFRSSKVRWVGLGIKGVILRGITGGGFKAILTVINSFILAYLSYQLWADAKFATTRIIVAIITFLFSGVIHTIYVATLYKLKLL